MAATARVDGPVDERVVEGVLVGGVLRPDDQAGRGRLTARHPGGELLGRARVVLRHGGGPQQVGQVPGMRHVALDGGDDRGRLRRPFRYPRAAARRPPSRRRPAPARPPRAAALRPPSAGPPAGPRTTQARQAPVSATRKVTNAGPPIATQRTAGEVAWLITSRPHGKPSHGQRLRTASQVTHQPATATGHARSRSSSHWPTTSTAKITARRHRERDVRVPGDVDQPGQQRKEERQAEDRAGGQRGPQPLPPERDDQQRGADRGQRPEAGRREGCGQGHATGDGDEEGLPAGQPRRGQRARASRGRARGRAGAGEPHCSSTGRAMCACLRA